MKPKFLNFALISKFVIFPILLLILHTPAFADFCIYEKSSGIIASASQQARNPDNSGIWDETACPNSLELANPRKKWNGSSVEDATAQDEIDYQAAVAADRTLQRRSKAVTDFDVIQGNLFVKGLSLAIMDELNALRSWTRDFKAEVAQANNLSDLKTRIANLPNLPDRTKNQIMPAVKSKINSGDAD